MNKRVAVHVLGCKVNQYEIEAIIQLFKEKNYSIVDFEEEADIYIIHTCTVTHLGDRKSRQYIRKAIKNNPKATVVVTGCYAQVSPQEIEKIEGVDIVIGTKDRKNIVEIVEKHQKGKVVNLVSNSKNNKDFEELPVVNPDRARAFLKIQEGCDRYCTYCIIPYARGPVKSRNFNSTIDEVKKLIDAGFKEIILTGIHTGTYGKDLPPGKGLVQLLENIISLKGLKRLRISSLDPDDITSDLLEIMTESSIICPHYHIPLQSGDDQILKKMGRRYTTQEYSALLAKIRHKRPDAAITTDVIVGFPGESDYNFNNTTKYITEIKFADLHVFKYSPRKGTPAATYHEQIAPQIKMRRSKELIELSYKLWREYAQGYLGKTLEVLVETSNNGIWEGHTDNYLKVKFFSDEINLAGKIIPVKLKEIKSQKFILGSRR